MVDNTSAIEELRKHLLREHEFWGSWQTVADNYGVTKPLVYRIANSKYEPKSPRIRIQLGLPEMKPAPVCPVHNVVHQYDCQTQKIVRTNGKPKARKPRLVVDLPADASPEVVQSIRSLSKQQRLSALLAYLEKEGSR